MDQESRAYARRVYKERKDAAKGIYRVSCTASGQIWVDSSSNLPASENRLSFSLQTGSMVNADVLAACKQFGPDAIRFEVLEMFDEGLSRLELNRQLKERRQHWQSELGAASLYR